MLEDERVPPPALNGREERLAQIERAILALEKSVRELTSELHALQARVIAQGKWMGERKQ